MTKDRILRYITGMIEVIKTSPELFHDGIDIEIMDLLKQIKKYINKEESNGMDN